MIKYANYIWGGMILASIITGALNGRLSQVASAAMSGAGEGVTLSLSPLRGNVPRTGLMKIADKSGLTSFLPYF